MTQNKDLRLLLSITVATSALLLFSVQPLVSKHILPYFGGGPSIWNTSLLFFQTFLLFGYLYAYVLTSRSWKIQSKVHSILITVVLITTITAIWSSNGLPTPINRYAPQVDIILFLIQTIGLSFFLLSSTSTLIQYWYSATHKGKEPYFLYAISNIGSLAALLGFPFLLEPSFRSGILQQLWQVGVIGYCLVLVLVMRKVSQTTAIQKTSTKSLPTWQELFRIEDMSVDLAGWILMPTLSAILLAALTQQVTLQVAPIPLLWILPLSLYLISFVICFSHKFSKFVVWYPRFFLFFLILYGWKVRYGVLLPPIYTLAIQMGLGFFGFLTLHQQVYNLRPKAQRDVGRFYLFMSLGSVIGTTFVALIAPIIFPDYWEYQGILFIIAALAVLLWSAKEILDLKLSLKNLIVSGSIALGLVSLTQHTEFENDTIISASRNFYGANKVLKTRYPEGEMKRIVNGEITHGSQFLDASKELTPTTYFSSTSGLAVSIQKYREWKQNEIGSSKLDIAIIGLGAGTISAYGETGDTITYIEINPEVATIAENEFSYLRKSAAETQVIVGDGRQVLDTWNENSFDIIILDAFTDDGVPVHLLTQEAIEIYFSKLKPDGYVIFHISSRYLNLEQLLAANLSDLGMEYLYLTDITQSRVFSSSGYMVASADLNWFGSDQVNHLQPTMKPWTDDYSSILQILKL